MKKMIASFATFVLCLSICAQGVLIFRNGNVSLVEGVNIDRFSPSPDVSMLYLVHRDSSVIELPAYEVDSLKFYNVEIQANTLNAIDITRNTATLCGTVTNAIATPEEVGFYVSIEQNPTELNGQKILVDLAPSFSATVSNLNAATTYYYRTYVYFAGKYYYGQTFTFTTSGYSIGDLYPNDTNPIGVVYDVDSNGKSGKIISLTTTYLNWNAARNWPGSLGSGWRLPTKDELKQISARYGRLNGHVPDGFYYSSTIYDANILDTLVWVVTVAGSSGYCGYTNGYTFYVSDSSKESVMAIKNF